MVDTTATRGRVPIVKVVSVGFDGAELDTNPNTVMMLTPARRVVLQLPSDKAPPDHRSANHNFSPAYVMWLRLLWILDAQYWNQAVPNTSRAFPQASRERRDTVRHQAYEMLAHDYES
jgi:hypothetical protein